MATHQVSFASDIGYAPSPSFGYDDNNSSSAIIYHLGGMCIRDYQLALQRSVNELKSREHQVNQLYSCLLDREETIARLNREIESLKQQLVVWKQRCEQQQLQLPLGSTILDRRGSTLISSHELAGELHQTVPTPLPLMHASHTTDSCLLITKSRRDRLRAALAKNDLLGRLDSEQADGLIGRMSEQRVQPGHVIIKEGEPGTRVYVMEDGEVDIHREGQFLCRLLAPMVFGELAVIYNAPRSATVTAATQCRLWSIESKAFHKCMTRIRQRTITKIALELKNITIFSSLSKTTLSAIVDAGEELHFSQGSHVSIAAGTLYIVTEGSLASPSLVCSCGNTDGHQMAPSMSTCSRQVIEIKATACFCTKLPQNVTSALSQSSDMSDVFHLSPDEVSTLKASEDNFTRVTCYRLDTNYVLRAIDRKSQEKQFLTVEQDQHRSISPMTSGDSSLGDSPSRTQSGRNSGENGVGISNLAITALLPSRDSFSHLFCVVDVRNTSRRNAVTLQDEEDGDPSEQLRSAVSRRSGGCYIMRWVLRQRADAAGMGERLSHERQHLLSCSSCDFIVQLVSTMQDPISVYFVYESCLGGTLESLLKASHLSSSGTTNVTSPSASTSTSTFSLITSMRRQNRNLQNTTTQSGRSGGGIDDDLARFYLACVVEALDFLHANGIVHRNVSPGSVWITSSGYGKLGDFTWTKAIGARSRTFSLCGPVERLAPEVMLNKGHGLAADRWSVGILLYEMLVGKPPFLRDDPMLTCSAILQHAGSNPGSSTGNSGGDVETLDFPRRIGKTVRDAIRRLCRASPADRITFDDLRQHPLFTTHNSGFDWQSFRNMQMTPPYVPNVISSTDVSNISGARKLVSTIPVSSLVTSCNKANMAELAAAAAGEASAGDPLGEAVALTGFDVRLQESFASSSPRHGLANWSKDF